MSRRILKAFAAVCTAALLTNCAPDPTPTTRPSTEAPSEALIDSAPGTVQTESYRIELLFGAVQSMMGSDMSMTDEGQPVNRHLELHIYDIASEAAVIGASPSVRIESLATGSLREFANVRECVPPNDHGAGHHYGDNAYLPGGKYKVTIIVGSESGTFEVSFP